MNGELGAATVIHGLLLEESRSRSGKHKRKCIVLLLLRDNGLQPVEKTGRVAASSEAKPVYARGWARSIAVAPGHGDYVVQLCFTRNMWGRVKGYISVYNYHGELVYRAKYVDGELRRSIGNPIYAWIPRLVAEQLRIPVKKTRLGDERR